MKRNSNARKMIGGAFRKTRSQNNLVNVFRLYLQTILFFLVIYWSNLMNFSKHEGEQNSLVGSCHDVQPTLYSLIDTIEFTKKPRVKSTKSMSQTDSISSSHSIDVKQKSKVWNQEEVELFSILLKKYGTDFHILSAFFPKKTKNQLKNRYKLYANMERKRERAESNNLRAISELFRQVEQREQKEERDEEMHSQTKMKDCQE